MDSTKYQLQLIVIETFPSHLMNPQKEKSIFPNQYCRKVEVIGSKLPFHAEDDLI